MPPRVHSNLKLGETSYEIIVQNKVDRSILPYLNGLSLSYDVSEDKSISILTGKLPDQAALNGVLDVLIDHRYLILSLIRNPINGR